MEKHLELNMMSASSLAPGEERVLSSSIAGATYAPSRLVIDDSIAARVTIAEMLVDGVKAGSVIGDVPGRVFSPLAYAVRLNLGTAHKSVGLKVKNISDAPLDFKATFYGK